MEPLTKSSPVSYDAFVKQYMMMHNLKSFPSTGPTGVSEKEEEEFIASTKEAVEPPVNIRPSDFGLRPVDELWEKNPPDTLSDLIRSDPESFKL